VRHRDPATAPSAVTVHPTSDRDVLGRLPSTVDAIVADARNSMPSPQPWCGA
jgi:hypothetical protein